MKKLIIIVIAFLTYSSCGDLDWDGSPEYYRFDPSDYEFIPVVYTDIGKIFKFKNNLNEEVSIKVSVFNYNKKTNGGWNWVGGSSTPIYYTEQAFVGFDLLDVNFPNIGVGYCDQLYISIEKQKNKTLNISLKIPVYTTFCSSTNLIITSPFNDFKVMTIDNVIYDKVKTFTTKKNYLFFNQSTVNKLYYDLKMGIIGFDDMVNNVEYRIINE